MKQKQSNQEDWNPWHVQECRRSHARQEGANLFEIARRLLHGRRFHAAKRQRYERIVDRLLKADIEKRRNATQHTSPQRVEISLNQIGKQHHQRETEQCCEIPARNDAIVNLEHVERAGQHQQIDHAAKCGNAGHSSRTLSQTLQYRIIRSRWCQQTARSGPQSRSQTILHANPPSHPSLSASPVFFWWPMLSIFRRQLDRG